MKILKRTNIHQSTSEISRTNGKGYAVTTEGPALAPNSVAIIIHANPAAIVLEDLSLMDIQALETALAEAKAIRLAICKRAVVAEDPVA